MAAGLGSAAHSRITKLSPKASARRGHSEPLKLSMVHEGEVPDTDRAFRYLPIQVVPNPDAVWRILEGALPA